MRKLVPVAPHLLELGGARIEHLCELIGKSRVGVERGHLDGVIVDLAVALQRKEPAAHLCGLLRIELRSGLVIDLLHVPDDRVGIEIRAVVELHAFAELERPPGLVLVIHAPFGGETGGERRRDLGIVELPVDEGVVHRIAHVTITFAAAVRLPGRERDFRKRHADAQRFRLRVRRRRRKNHHDPQKKWINEGGLKNTKVQMTRFSANALINPILKRQRWSQLCDSGTRRFCFVCSPQADDPPAPASPDSFAQTRPDNSAAAANTAPT